MSGARNPSHILKNIESWSGVRERDPAGPWKFWDAEADAARAAFIINLVAHHFSSRITVRAVKTLADYDGDLKSLYSGTFQGKYRVDIDGEQPLIVHVKKSVDRKQLNIGAKVFSHLRENGIFATEIVPAQDGGLVCEYEGYAVYFTRFMAGRHLFAVRDEVYALGKTVGNMGRAMRSLPAGLKEEIKENSAKNLSFMKEGYDFIAGNAVFFDRHFPGFSDDLCAAANRILHVPENGYAPSHYDPIEKNLIYDGKEVCILDIDRVGDGWAPWHMDAGVALARGVLNSPENEASAGTLPPVTESMVRPFLEGYNATSDRFLTVEEMGRAGMDGAASRIAIICAFMERGDWNEEKSLLMLREFLGYFHRAQQAAIVLGG